MSEKRTELTEEHVSKYIETTTKALEKLKIIAPEKSYAHKIANDFLEMAKAYHSDALDFFEKGDYVNAFACVNYAHGWLDCGARLGVFDVGQDDQLFTLME